MASHKTISYVSLLLLFISLTLSSCSKDNDLFDETIQNQIEEETTEDGELINSVSFSVNNDEFTISGAVESAILDVLKNDSIPSQDLESFQIVAVSDALEGDISLNEDNTITYSPKPESANKAGNNGMVSDEFTYTVEVRGKGSQNKYEKKATVVVNTQYGDVDMGAVKAFPGAEGFGRNATGGRGGRIIHVTNLNDSGPGSLRAAIEAQGPRIVVFDVGGDIFLENPLQIREANGKGSGDLSVLGQTAPYPGITIRNYGIEISESNIILRYLTIRLKETRDTVITRDCLRIKNFDKPLIENFILDHLTFSHGDDEVVSFNGIDNEIRNVTLQNSMVGESNTSYNILVGTNVFNLTVFGNYLHNTSDRNVLYGYGLNKENAEQINNVIYGYDWGTTVAWGSIVDIISNVYKKGYPNGNGYAIGYGVNTYNNPNALETDGDLHVNGNFQIDGHILKSSGAQTYSEPNRVITNSLIESWEHDSENIITNVLGNCGNSIHRDEMDLQDITDFYNGTGNWETETIPNKTAGYWSESYDTDQDGMADTWEIRTFGDLLAAPSDDYNGNGYTNIEEFVFSLIPNQE
ncbi:hypothetical protein GO009_14885 [Muricauda sp. TY007]|uniref:Ig-like domain-containing protein n=1 Tax=Allomuricauda sp. TY007 TaxID=2683200 RepID=UPI0013C12A73|nr:MULTISPECIES: Ig-like domain-containing protein [unclassified Allomuricauda]MBA4744722.1 hypothetical protein [Allomuricauda sp.]NDV17307.1 hypothetical protein [Muricauda sp. TY007]